VKKFVFIYHGYMEPAQDTMDAWMKWFAEIGDSIVDSGNPFGPGREVTPSGRRDLPLDAGAASGYTIVNAESLDAAEKLLANCPIITSVRIYEAIPM
jgi:hypothetical protein